MKIVALYSYFAAAAVTAIRTDDRIVPCAARCIINTPFPKGCPTRPVDIDCNCSDPEYHMFFAACVEIDCWPDYGNEVQIREYNEVVQTCNNPGTTLWESRLHSLVWLLGWRDEAAEKEKAEKEKAEKGKTAGKEKTTTTSKTEL